MPPRVPELTDLGEGLCEYHARYVAAALGLEYAVERELARRRMLEHAQLAPDTLPTGSVRFESAPSKPPQRRVRMTAMWGDGEAFRTVERVGEGDQAWASAQAEILALGPEWQVVAMSDDALEPSHSSGVTVLVS